MRHVRGFRCDVTRLHSLFQALLSPGMHALPAAIEAGSSSKGRSRDAIWLLLLTHTCA